MTSGDSGLHDARYFHPEKTAAYLRRELEPESLVAAGALLSGMSIEGRRRRGAVLDAQVEGAARELATRPPVSEALRGLPFTARQNILALGDSITDDTLSWAHQLDWLLSHERADLGLRVLNAGKGGETTADAISRLDTVATNHPDWVIMMLGTNDARRHGAAPGRTMLSPSESERNIAALLAELTTHVAAQVVVLTPPPILDRRADAWEPFTRQGLSWRDEDAALVTAAIQRVHPDAVDVRAEFLSLDTPNLLEQDGVHPTLSGQQVIVTAVLSALSRLPDTTPHRAGRPLTRPERPPGATPPAPGARAADPPEC